MRESAVGVEEREGVENGRGEEERAGAELGPEKELRRFACWEGRTREARGFVSADCGLGERGGGSGREGRSWKGIVRRRGLLGHRVR